MSKSATFMGSEESEASSSTDEGHDSPREAFEHGVEEIAQGVADLAAAFIESLSHGGCFDRASMSFRHGGGGRGRD